MNNKIFLSFLFFALTFEFAWAGDKAVIWLGGMEGTQGLGIWQTEASVNRVVTIYESLIKKGISPDDIYIHVSAGKDTPVIKRNRLKNAMPSRYTMDHFDDVDSDDPSILNFFKKKGLPVSPSNIRQGTDKHAQKTFEEIGKRMDKNGGDKLLVYTTSGMEENIHPKTSPADGLNALVNENGDYYLFGKETPVKKEAPKEEVDIYKTGAYENYVKQIVEEYQHYSSVVEEANNNPQKFKELFDLSDEDLKNENLQNIKLKLGDCKQFEQRPIKKELCIMSQMNSDEKKNYINSKIKKAENEAKGMDFRISPRVYGSNEFRAYFSNIKSGKIVVFNELNLPIIPVAIDNACEYHSPLKSDAKGKKITESFAQSISNGSSIKQAVKDAEDLKAKKDFQFGKQGRTSLDLHLTHLIYKYEEQLKEIDSRTQNKEFQTVNICVGCANQDLQERAGKTAPVNNLTIDIKALFTPREELKKKVARFLEKKSISEFGYFDYITDEEAKNIDNMIDCLSVRF